MDALGKLYTSATIVTMKVEGELNGIAVAWITRVSIKPPMIAISIGKTRYSDELLNKTDRFGVCIMESGEKKTVAHFGSLSGRDCDKFENIPFNLSETGIPILPGTVAYLECVIKDRAAAGDHTLFIAEIVAQKLYEEEKPLLYGEHRIL